MATFWGWGWRNAPSAPMPPKCATSRGVARRQARPRRTISCTLMHGENAPAPQRALLARPALTKVAGSGTSGEGCSLQL